MRAGADPAPAPAPPAGGPPEPPPPSADGPDLDLDDVIVAWGELLPNFSPATRASIQAAQPLRVDGDVVVFGVAPVLLEAARPRFKKEADTIRAALADRFGRSVKFNLVAADDFSAVGDADRARPEPAATPPDPPAPPEPDPSDLDDAADATDAPPRRPEARFTEEFGATVVDEVPRQ